MPIAILPRDEVFYIIDHQLNFYDLTTLLRVKDYKDCYDVGMVDKLREMKMLKEKKDNEAKEKETNEKKWVLWL